MTVHLENSFIEISYDENINAIVNNWKTAPTSAEFRQGMNAAVEAMRRFDTGALISDTGKLGALSEEDQQWSYTEWLQQALQAGYHSFAVIVSPDIFAQMSVEDTLSQVQNVTIQYFESYEEGRKWLKENEKVS